MSVPWSRGGVPPSSSFSRRERGRSSSAFASRSQVPLKVVRWTLVFLAVCVCARPRTLPDSDRARSATSRVINISWRAVWTVSARCHARGWTAEFAIPLRTLRSTGGTDGTVGFNVHRSIRRKSEEALWRSWRPESEGFVRVSLAGYLQGVTVAAPGGVGVDVKPYALVEGRQGGSDIGGGSGSGVAATSARGGTGTTGHMDLGLDLKYEVRPGLVIDDTANADFSQAEVDDEQVNLTRFDLFLPEQREFFLENRGVFEFGVRGSADPPPFLLFFSRRIGISEDGPVPLLGGTRMSGRVGRQTVGFLHTVTD